MNLSDEQAQDEVLVMLLAYWNTESALVNNAVAVAVEFDGVDAQDSRPPTKPWARFSIQSTVSEPTGLGGAGGVRYERSGIVSVQVFTPLVLGSKVLAVRLSSIARQALEGKCTPGGVTFSKQKVTQVGHGDGWYQINVTHNYLYDEVR